MIHSQFQDLERQKAQLGDPSSIQQLFLSLPSLVATVVIYDIKNTQNICTFFVLPRGFVLSCVYVSTGKF